MSSIQHHHTALHVQSIDLSARFYVDGLGLKQVRAWRSGPYIGELFGRPGVVVNAVMLATEDGFNLELVQVEDPPPAIDPSQASPGTAHLAFTGIDVAAVFERLSSLGYSALSKPVAPSSGPVAGGLLVYMLDPDGNRVELIQPPEWKPTGA